MLHAASFGIYETSLPLFLSHIGISFMSMGIIFGVSQVGILAVRYAVGTLSDRHGRKPFFLASAGLVAASTALVPVWPSAMAQAALKVLRDAAGVSRDIVRSVVLYEHARSRFVRWIGRAIGSEFFFMAGGAYCAGFIISRAGYGWAFAAAGGLAAAAFLTIWRMFKETRRKKTPPAPGVSGRLVGIGLDLPPNLWIISACSFIFNVGLMMSHSFYLLLFFREKFGFSIRTLGIIQALHRFSLSIPTILAAQWIDRPKIVPHYKKLYVITMAAQGVCISLAGALPNAWLAIAFFLLHDLVGSPFFGTIHAGFVQRYARPERRGRDVAFSSGLAALGFVFGPPLAGWLVDELAWRDGPFIMSGIIISSASLLMLRLKEKPFRLANEPAKTVA